MKSTIATVLFVDLVPKFDRGLCTMLKEYSRCQILTPSFASEMTVMKELIGFFKKLKDKMANRNMTFVNMIERVEKHGLFCQFFLKMMACEIDDGKEIKARTS